MFINRKLLKASDISSLNQIQKLEILAFARKQSQKNGYEPEIFCGIKESSFKGFESNNSLKIWDGSFFKTLESCSALIKTLTKTDHSSFSINQTNGQLSLANQPNFEEKSQYNLQILSTDSGGKTISKKLTITVTDANDAPTVANAIADQSVNEDSALSFQFASNTF